VSSFGRNDGFWVLVEENGQRQRQLQQQRQRQMRGFFAALRMTMVLMWPEIRCAQRDNCLMWPEIRRAQNDNGFWCGLNFAALRMTIV
jgi:hypothetical protein